MPCERETRRGLHASPCVFQGNCFCRSETSVAGACLFSSNCYLRIVLGRARLLSLVRMLASNACFECLLQKTSLMVEINFGFGEAAAGMNDCSKKPSFVGKARGSCSFLLDEAVFVGIYSSCGECGSHWWQQQLGKRQMFFMRIQSMN